MDLDDAADFVRKGLELLGDELRETGLDEQGRRCDQMAKMLGQALYDNLAQTQPIEPQDKDE